MTAKKMPSMRENKQWFLENKDTLIPLYRDKFILIVDRKIVKVSEDAFELADFGRDNFVIDSYCVTKCAEPITYKMAPLIWAINATTQSIHE